MAGDGLGRDQALRDRLVGQHRLAGGVADGEDPRIGGAALRVHHDEPAPVSLGARVLEPEIVGGGTAPHRHQQVIDLQARRRAVAGELDLHRVAFRPDRRELGPEQDLLEPLAEAAAERRDQVPVHSRQEPVEQLHDGDLAAERRVDAPQLEADVSASDHEQPGGRRRQRQRGGRVPHARPRLDPRQGRGPRAGGDDRVLELERRRGRVVPGHADGAVGLEPPAARHHVHAADLREARESLGKAVDGPLGPRAQLRGVDGRPAPKTTPASFASAAS